MPWASVAYRPTMRPGKVGPRKNQSKLTCSSIGATITTYGIEKNKNANLLVQNEVVMDDLFSDKK